MRTLVSLFLVALAAIFCPTVSMAQDYGLDTGQGMKDYGLGDFHADTTTYFTPEQGQDISARLYRSLDQWAATGDPSAYAQQLDPDVRYVRLGDGIDVTGVKPAIAAMGSLLQLATGISFSVDSVRVSGAYIISFGIATGTVAGTDYRLTVPFGHAVLMNVETNKVAAIGDGTDLDALRAQIAAAMATAVQTGSWGSIKAHHD